jgi:hypothetical protein
MHGFFDVEQHIEDWEEDQDRHRTEDQPQG